MTKVLKYGGVFLIFIGIFLAVWNFKGVINAEIPVDYLPDPMPLQGHECVPPASTEPWARTESIKKANAQDQGADLPRQAGESK